MERFALLIDELSEEMDVPLAADPELRCHIVINESLHIQLEAADNQERVLLVAVLADVPAGKYREVLFTACLKHNALPFPRYGTLGYLQPLNQLVMHEFLSIHELDGPKLHEFLGIFITKAQEWKGAIESGAPLPTGVEEVKKAPSPMEGL